MVGSINTTKGKEINRMVDPNIWPLAMTLTLDFQGQILKKKLYIRNGRIDWHVMKGMSQ